MRGRSEHGTREVREPRGGFVMSLVGEGLARAALTVTAQQCLPWLVLGERPQNCPVLLGGKMELQGPVLSSWVWPGEL